MTDKYVKMGKIRNIYPTSVVIMNGPPSSGKDDAAQFLVNKIKSFNNNAVHKEVKENLFRAVKSAYGVPEDVWDELYQRENKELPSYYLVNNGRPISPRQAMINMSEDVLKPLFGKTVFGKMAANSVVENAINVFSDGGFVEEAICLADRVGEVNTLIIQIERQGYTFEGDSRGYITLPNVKCVRIVNNGTLDEFHANVWKAFEEFWYYE